MAFSMFLRTPACKNLMSSQPSVLSQRLAAICPAALKLLINENTRKSFTPIYNAVRPFQTSTSLKGLHGSEKPHDHAKLWVVEKAVTALMLPLVPMSLLLPNKLFDCILALLISAHSFWGLEACVLEYCRHIVVGPAIARTSILAVYGFSVFLLGGLFFVTFNDLGLCRSFWRLWRNMRNPKPPRKTC